MNDPKPVELAGVSKKVVSEDKSEADEDKSLAAKQEEDHVEVDENEDEEDDDGSVDVTRPSGPETYQMHPLYESCRLARVILCVGVIFPLPLRLLRCWNSLGCYRRRFHRRKILPN